ncbi:sensor histidine kinase [Chitinophaga sancti]|uniref:sensor histidine kinase n=1 Tax=Chitinophaga sancti TaxID=1004 RepID=UPI003F797529
MLLVTPVFLVRNVYPSHIWIGFPFATIGIFITWMLHIFLIGRVTFHKNRFFISTFFMIALTTITYGIGRMNHLIIPGTAFYLFRIVNIVAVNSMIFIISVVILLNRTKKKLDIENEQLKFANLQSRYEVLHNQLNPHFLFNAIGTAKALIRKDPAIADEYLVKLSSFLRLGLENKKFDTIPVKEELALCEDYIALQQMRFDTALQFASAIEEKYLSYVVPYFAILILVENAVKHNNMTEEEPLKITVTNNETSLLVSNNIRPRFLLEESSKMGLQNLKERYRLLYGETVTVNNDGEIFCVSIKMIRK